MKKFRVLSLLIVILTVTAMVVGCTSSTTPTSAPTATAAPTSTATATAPPGKQVKVLFSNYYPAGLPTKDYYDTPNWYMDEVEKRTGGRVVFDRHFGGDLTKPGEEDDQLKDGLVDMAIPTSIFSPGTMPLWEMDGSLPFRPSDDTMVAQIKWQLFNEFPELKAEISRLNAEGLYVNSYGSYQTIANRPLPDVASYKDLKVAVIGRFMPRWYSSIGGIPITMVIPDRYSALQSGIIDASSLSVSSHRQYKYYEQAKHQAMPYFGCYAAMCMAIRNDKLKEISAEDQAIMREVGQEVINYRNGDYTAQLEGEAAAAMEELGVTFYYYDKEQRETWAQSIDNFAQEWINEAKNDADHDVRVRMWLRYLELTQEKGYEWPMDWSNVT